MTDQEFRRWARELYQSDDIQIDDDAEVSRGEQGGDSGVFVQAWIWVPND